MRFKVPLLVLRIPALAACAALAPAGASAGDVECEIRPQLGRGGAPQALNCDGAGEVYAPHGVPVQRLTVRLLGGKWTNRRGEAVEEIDLGAPPPGGRGSRLSTDANFQVDAWMRTRLEGMGVEPPGGWGSRSPKLVSPSRVALDDAARVYGDPGASRPVSLAGARSAPRYSCFYKEPAQRVGLAGCAGGCGAVCVGNAECDLGGRGLVAVMVACSPDPRSRSCPGASECAADEGVTMTEGPSVPGGRRPEGGVPPSFIDDRGR